VIVVGGASPAMPPIAEDDLHSHAGTAVINRTGMTAVAAQRPTVRGVP
jgi:hypothetical protein